MQPFRALLASLVLALCTAAALGLPAGAAENAGAYAVSNLPNAGACARACRDDGLCIAWTFRDGACALSAVAPTHPDPSVVSGVSPRAPTFAAASYDIRGPSAPPAEPQAEFAALDAPLAPEDANLVLLGGPEGDTATD